MSSSKILQKITLHFFPLTCPICKNSLIENIDSVCESCYKQLEFISEPYCASCGGTNDTIFEICSQCLKEYKHNWTHAISIFKMKSYARDALIRFKYYKETPLARPLSKFVSDRIIKDEISADYLTYIPLHWKRHLKRGFNQSRLVTNKISKHTGIPTIKALKRIHNTRTQTQLDSKARHKNIRGAFKSINSHLIQGNTFLLFDDVYTTGTTLREAAKTLLSAKAKEIKIITLARR